MKLSNSYKYITGMFNTPLEYSRPPEHYSYDSHYYFKVGKCEYEVIFYEINKSDVYDVQFYLKSMKVTPQEKIDLIERVTKEKLNLEFETLGVETLDSYFRRFIGKRRYDVIGVGSASVVLGHVIQIMDAFRKSHRVKCYQFSADEESRVDLYKALVRKFMKSGTRKITKGDKPKKFIICFD